MLAHRHGELDGHRYVVFVDGSRQYTDCTDDVCELLGYTREELLQRKIEDISYERDVAGRFAEYMGARAQEGDYVLQHKNRTPVPVRYRAFQFSDGCRAAVWEPLEDWRRHYYAALLETDGSRLAEKITIALEAIEKEDRSNMANQRIMDKAAVRLRSLARGSGS
jgi:PAS domain-containing protein